MQYKVPQNIDMEDKIIGPLTLSQFFYLLFGGIIIYILFKNLALSNFRLFFWLLAIPIGLFSFAMAFLKVQDRPFPSFVVAAIRFLRTPRQRAWQHYTPAVKSAVRNPRSETKKEEKVTKKQFDALQAQEVAEILDNPGGSNAH